MSEYLNMEELMAEIEHLDRGMKDEERPGWRKPEPEDSESFRDKILNSFDPEIHKENHMHLKRNELAIDIKKRTERTSYTDTAFINHPPAEAIKFLRRRLSHPDTGGKISQKELGRFLGFSEEMIHSVEAGRRKAGPVLTVRAKLFFRTLKLRGKVQ